MRKVDLELKYDPDLNTWVKHMENVVEIGLTDWAQNFVGKISAISDLPKVGSQKLQNMLLCTIESNKTTTEIFMPISGEIIELNSRLLSSPEGINFDCYRSGWILRIVPKDPDQFNTLLSGLEYKCAIDSFFQKSS